VQRFSAAYIVAAALGTMSAVLIITPFITHIWLLCIAYCISGVGLVLFDISCQVVLRSVFDPDTEAGPWLASQELVNITPTLVVPFWGLLAINEFWLYQGMGIVFGALGAWALLLHSLECVSGRALSLPGRHHAWGRGHTLPDSIRQRSTSDDD
jgi:MFS family permease